MYKILCSKNDVVLKRAVHPSSENMNTFIIDFEIANSEITLDRFCNFNIFKLLFELNREDAIQDLRITDAVVADADAETSDTSTTKDILLIFKKKCDDVGIKQKYMKTRLTLSTVHNDESGVSNYVFESNSGNNNSGNNNSNNNKSNSSEPAHSHLLSGLEELRDIGAVLCMSLLNAHQLRMQFKILVPISEQKQPSYIENSLALIMKKIFTRLKTFIEVMKLN
jgi:hypothetical protein